MEPIREWVVVLWLVFAPSEPLPEAVIYIYRGEKAWDQCETQRKRHTTALRRSGRKMRCEWFHAKVNEEND